MPDTPTVKQAKTQWCWGSVLTSTLKLSEGDRKIISTAKEVITIFLYRAPLEKLPHSFRKKKTVKRWQLVLRLPSTDRQSNAMKFILAPRECLVWQGITGDSLKERWSSTSPKYVWAQSRRAKGRIRLRSFPDDVCVSSVYFLAALCQRISFFLCFFFLKKTFLSLFEGWKWKQHYNRDMTKTKQERCEAVKLKQ